MSEFFDQSHFDIRCEWGKAGIERLAPSDVIVVVDVLSFTTTVDIALSRGVTILPFVSDENFAKQYAHAMNAELAGTRSLDKRIRTLSPASMIDAPHGLRLVLPSPNGAKLSFEAGSRVSAVLAGCLRNASAVAMAASRLGRRISVIPAGEHWPDGRLRPAFEDLIGAGAIIRALPGSRSPEAQAAVAAFESVSESLYGRLAECSSGRELIERDYAKDVQLAAEFDVSATAPLLREGEFVSELL